MNLKYGIQINIEDIETSEIDLFLFANNVEKRKLEAYLKIKALTKIKEAVALNYSRTDTIPLADKNIQEVFIESLEQIKKILAETILSTQKSEVNIIIDYSCMTKPWYYTILSYLAEKKIEKKKINCFFIYTPSTFSEPLPPKPNSKIEPIEGSFKIPNPKPKALIVCLGYEQNKAQGIIDQLDPKLTFICYTDPALDDEFVKAVVKNNNKILSETSDELIFKFPFDDTKFLEKKLTSLYYQLRDDYNIVIAPLGPKPFTFASMILSIIFPEIEVWRVDSGLDINKYIRTPFDPPKFIVNKLIFQ